MRRSKTMAALIVLAVGVLGFAIHSSVGHRHEAWLLHPVAVHFPIALLTVGLAVGIWSRIKRHILWLPEAAFWLLWLGTTAAWVAMGMGLLAEETAPHVPLAWQTMNLHRTLGFWTVGSFTVLSVLRWRLRERWPVWFLILWTGACGLILATGYQGGELVFTHGMGVQTEH